MPTDYLVSTKREGERVIAPEPRRGEHEEMSPETTLDLRLHISSHLR